MSCGLHDVARIEARGVPAVLVATRPFREEDEAQAELLGFRQHNTVWVDHPVQTLSDPEVARLARRAYPEIRDALTG